uniref:Lactamase_B domain-containing protein n=1 Tax=Caenorhabditis tropicalis TaxID=1561998 RepID=A0A1I7TFZ9_9PELO
MKLLIIATTLLVSGACGATTEQLRQWILNNRESLNGQNDLAGSILRLFGWGADKTTDATTETLTEATTTIEPRSHSRDVCPFFAEPLILANDFAYCRPASLGDCPVGYLCDQSVKLGRSICCKDTRRGIVPNGRPVRPTQRLPLTWSTVTPTAAPSQPISTATSRKAPWYIKDRTAWPTYNRISAEKALQKTSTIIESTTTTTTTTSEPTTTTATITTTISTPQSTTPYSEPKSTTNTQPTTSSTTTTAEPITTTQKVNSWAKLWTSTIEPKSFVNVTVLQAGSVRSLRDGQAEAVGAITLVNDNGYIVLIDTGASSDTERLLHSKFF